MFYCRENELSVLNRRYERGSFECIIIYGRRRVGKTALINEFCRDKPTIFFSALNASAKENLEALSSAIYLFKSGTESRSPVYNSFQDALNEISVISGSGRLVFVIDEYPYLARADNSLSSRLQHLIDHVWKDTRLFLILCGSSMSFMENQVLGYKSPLYGRRTAQIKLQALTYKDTAKFSRQLDKESQALLYGVTGGIPHYINKLDAAGNIDDALLDNFFSPDAYLFEEPENLLKQELREPAIYNSVISAIAGGASHSNEISTRVGLESGVCAKYIRVLLNLGILKKETPVTEKPGRKTIYTIEDNFFRFWYRFVPRNMSLIRSGRIRQAYSQVVKRYYSDYMGMIFEKMCREYLMLYCENLPFLIRDAGQWWGTDPGTRRQVQIDVVGESIDGDEYIVGSCKYKNEKVGTSELGLLKQYASVFNSRGRFHYYIFSKGGFTDALREEAANGRVRLLSLEDLYR